MLYCVLNLYAFSMKKLSLKTFRGHKIAFKCIVGQLMMQHIVQRNIERNTDITESFKQ